MKNTFKIMGLIALVSPLIALITGCASIIHGGMQNVSIRSNPAEATATMYNSAGAVVLKQNTPCTVSLKRGEGFFKKASYRLVVDKAGYAPFETEIVGQIDGWYLAGNFVFGGLVGWIIVDPATGAMWTLKPSEVNANLAKQHSSLMSQEDGTLIVMLREEVPADLVSYMKPVHLK